MEITLASIKLVSMQGYKSQWKIFPEDVVDVDGQDFVRLKAFHNGGLLHMVFEANDLVTLDGKTVLKGCSLSCSKGLSQIMIQRNTAQMMDITKNTKSNLFNPKESGGDQSGGPWVKKSLLEHKEQRSAPTPMNIIVKVDEQEHEVQVLVPSHPSDALWVRYDAATIGYVIKYLRNEGLSEPKKYKDLPKDISQSGELFVAVHKDETSGRKKYKTSKELDAVVAWKALVSSDEQE